MKELTLKSVLNLFYNEVKLKFFNIVDLWNIQIKDLKSGWQVNEQNCLSSTLIITNNKFKIQYNNAKELVYLEMKLKNNFIKYYFINCCAIRDEVFDINHGIEKTNIVEEDYFLKTGKIKKHFIYDFYWKDKRLI